MKKRHFPTQHFWSTIFTFLFSAQAAAEPSQQAQLGFQLGQGSIAARGYLNGNITIMPITRFFVLLDLSTSSSLNLYTETSSNVYMSSGLCYRYFPTSVSSRRTIKGDSYIYQYSDPLKPFVGVGFGLGRVRLETKDEIGATEISANYYGPELNMGFNHELTERWNLDAMASYSFLIASSDSTVEFSGTRISLLFGGSRSF